MASQVPLWLQTTDVVLDALAASSWPIAFGISVLLFRKPIINLLSRVRRFNGFGGEAEFNALENPAQLAAHADGGRLALPGGNNIPYFPPPDPVYTEFDQATRDVLDAEAAGEAERQLAWAIRMRSISEANRIHERNYRMIFGSQIAALRALNTATEAKVDEFRPFFSAALQNPDWKDIHDGRTFEQWGQFILDTGYARIIEDSEPAKVQITPFGKQFLLWMIETRSTEMKGG